MTIMHPVEILFTDGAVKTILMDSISYVTADNSGDIIVSGSHGGTSSAGYAIDVQVAAAFFNDAGIGKNRAGVLGLEALERHGIIAAAVSHESAEIANARDTYEHGIITQVNGCAASYGLAVGQTVAAAVYLLRSILPK